jgi:group I intron endonuclease
MNKICGIYKITSPSGKIYIGQSRNIKRRLNDYINNRCYEQLLIYRSINKYGWNMHKFEVIHECTEPELNYLEKYYIKFYDTFDTKHGMNLTSGGDHIKLSKESLRKISDSSKNRIVSQETRDKFSKIHKWKKISKEHKSSLRKFHLGKKHTKESIEKMRIIKLNKKPSNETKEKLRIVNTGKKRSDITKEKIRKSKLGNKIWLGKKHSEETKQKLSEIHKNNYEIYNQNNELVHKFRNTIRLELKKW